MDKSTELKGMQQFECCALAIRTFLCFLIFRLEPLRADMDGTALCIAIVYVRFIQKIKGPPAGHF
jgi:hypothetical protein